MGIFDIDRWQEIFNSIRRHPLRTALTALGIFWGIFMLVLLLGAGRGLQNGIEHEFRDDATNSIWIRRGTTSMPHEGLPKGRQIQFDNEDYEMLTTQFRGIDKATGRYYLSGNQLAVYKDKRLSFSTRAVHPGHQEVENTIMQEGRYLNEADLHNFRKVAVIGKIVKEDLFGEEDAIGKEIKLGGIIYKVIGTYTDTGSDNEMRIIYIPITTAQKVYAGTDEIHQLMVTTKGLDVEETKALQAEMRYAFAARHGFSPEDQRAISMFSALENFQQFMSLMGGIRLFIWFVGLGSIIAGVIGISNIMLIVVKDRTREIGIRKALGATPLSIISMILQESILITAIAGYLGLVCGVALIGLLGSMEVDFFRNPQVDLGVGLSATVVLIVAGALAGLMPARQAARINPIEAMRS